MKAYILKEKSTNKYFNFELGWANQNIKPVKFAKCFKTRQMAERYLSQMLDKWKNELHIVQVEIKEIEQTKENKQ